MKKSIALLLVLALLSGTVFGQGTAEQAKTSEGPIELTFWSLFTGGDGEFFDAMVDEFNKSQNEIVMKNDTVKFDNYYTKLTTALAAKNAPDVVVCHQANLLNYIGGSLEPLNDYVDQSILDDFQKAPLSACYFDGKLFSLPLDVHPIVMYYNKDILKAAGIDKIPASAEEFISAAKTVKEKTGKWGLAIDNTTGTYKAYTLTRLFYSMIYQQGGTYLTDDMKKANFNNEKGEKALQWLTDLVCKYDVNPNELDYDAAMNMFKLGDAAFYFNGVWATGTLEKTEGLNFGAAPLPAFFGSEGWAWGGSHTLAIPVQKNSDPAKIKAAVKFIDWMTSHGEMWAKAGHIPTRKSVAEKAEFKALPYRADYAAAAKYVQAPPATKAWEEIYGTCSDMLEAAVTKNQNAKEALAGMEKAVNEIISKY